MASPRRPFDAWARHPTAFSAHALEVALDAVGLTAGALGVDPFTGSGTSATQIVNRGDRFFGLEAHPLSADLAQVKLSRPGSPESLRAAAAETINKASKRRLHKASPAPVLERFVAHDALSELFCLRQVVEDDQGPWQGHLRWLILGALRRHAVGGWPYPRPGRVRELRTPSELVLAGAEAMAADLAAAPRRPIAEVVRGDARLPASWSSIPPGVAGGSVSSPPYLNQVSYSELLRLEVHLLGWAHTWAEMRELGRDLVACCTQEVTQASSAAATEHLLRFPGIATAVSSLTRRLERAQSGRSRPKRYDRLLPAYFSDMSRVLMAMYPVMAPGARAAWVIGDSAPYDVYVDTPALLGLVATEIGFEVLDDIHLRERGGRWASPGRRHNRRLSERLLVFRRPSWGEQLELSLAP